MVYLDDSMHIRMGKIKLRKLLFGAILFVAVIFYLFSSQFLTKKGQIVRNGIINSGFNKITDKIRDWLKDQVLGISYEERFCKHVTRWNSSSAYPPVKIIAKQLNIKNGDSIFINGLHCGEWLLALKGTFPDIQLYGVDKDPLSVKYVSKLVNGTYKVAEPFKLDRDFAYFDVKFDHAVVDGILSVYSEDLQCKTVRQMIPMLKAAGSLYIGKNFEQCEENKEVEKHLQKYLHIQFLPKCYWSRKCLFERTDVAEILYSHEQIMLNEDDRPTVKVDPLEKKKEELLIDFSSCATSIFIHKHIVLLSKKESNGLIPDSKYILQKHNHVCTHSEAVNSTKGNRLMDKHGIKKAVMDMKLRGLDMH